MINYTLQAFKKALVDSGIGDTKHCMLHSSLLNLGLLRDTSVTDIPSLLFDQVREVMGEEGNLYMPAFAYEFPKTRKSDLSQDKTCIGVWPEWFRKQPGVVRSGHPMFSLCGYGKEASHICCPDQAEFNSFSGTSTFARLLEADALILFLGISIRVATFVVYCEANLGVRYRYMKPFFGEVKLQGGESVQGNFFHYCFPLAGGYRENYKALSEYLLKEQLMKKIPLGMSYILSVKARDLYASIQNLVGHNPYFLLNSVPNNYYRYENGEEVAYGVD